MSINNFASIQVRLASPETILEWSHGEVLKPETINYRSQKAERDGLYCEKIFGPTKDWECACGKYKKVRFKGVVCDKCGVEITKASVRRERMGHIRLAAPVAHIWYLRGIPSRMALLLGVTPKELEEVVYFVSYIVTNAGDSKLAYKQVLSESEYRENLAIYGKYDPITNHGFEAQTGAEAVLRLLQAVDLEEEYKDIQEQLEKASGEKRKKLIKRLDTVNAFRNSDNDPSWMILQHIPVIPPDLRPMLQLDGGRFATSDLNDLYRRVITRNTRLKRLLDLSTPNIIVQNEKRMLQEAVDALIDNGRRSKPITGAGGRALKSLSHSLKGKQGRFRQNLLGKRVDFSGRSVIAVGPDLKMYQCGIPREMAINLFKPFVINEIVNQKLAPNPKNAEKLIERRDPRIWDVVEKVIDGYPVLMNRAPTLHRLGIQAFLPKLVEGRAMRLHPLVCTAFNADFDGDQMAIHVPLSEEARAEALVMMLGSHNILGPKDGKPIVTPGQDMVMGNFYLTMEETKAELEEEAERFDAADCPKEAALWRTYAANEGHLYADVEEVMMAYKTGQVHLHSRIAVPVKGMHKTSFDPIHANDYLVTTVGKIIFNNMFPSEFPYLNEVTKENFDKTPDKYFISPGENIKEYIAQLPITSAVKKKDLGKVIAEVFNRFSVDETSEIMDQIKDMGFKYSTVAGITVSLSDIEVAPNKEQFVNFGRGQAEKLKYFLRKGMLTTEEWGTLLKEMWDGVQNDITDGLMATMPRKNPINMMSRSGARGNRSNFTQLAGMRGLMAKPGHGSKAGSSEYILPYIEVPIYSCFREGLNVSEFFTSTHGVRKGLTDTALKTAESGYLTRRLVDVAQNVIIKDDDCGTDKGYMVSDLIDRKTNTKIESFIDRISGRYSKQDVFDPKTGELIIASDEYITDSIAKRIVDAGITKMLIRSVFTCKSRNGICRMCYGRNMATGKDVEIGEAVGVMAAQSIGEPGTQLTMRTFHTGGVAGAGDITQGLPRVEELFEARCPKGVAVIAQISGTITAINKIEGTPRQEVVITNEQESHVHKINGNQTLRSWVEVGEQIEAGKALTEGPLDPKELLKVAGVSEVQDYILKEVKKVYQSQGIEISDKHLEVMIKQMMKKVIIVDKGDTDLNVGVQLSLNEMTRINRDALLSGKTPATFKPVLLGISKASVETDSFLSAASFQETTKVLTDATIKGKVDYLVGLKENVIIGKLIPAGTGCVGERPQNAIVAAKAKELRDKRIARMKEVQDDQFDKIVSANVEETAAVQNPESTVEEVTENTVVEE